MRLYLAGPIRGHIDFKAKFSDAAAALRAAGHEVFDPTEKVLEHQIYDTSVAFARKVFGEDTGWICGRADGVMLLPGWEKSRGAVAEKALAEAIGLQVFYFEWWKMQHASDLGLMAKPADKKPTEALPAGMRATAFMGKGLSARRSTPPYLFSAGSAERKLMPVASGVLAYFPDALAAVAYVSYLGNEKHNPGEPLHWSQDKSADHLDCAARHLAGSSTIDGDDGTPHSWKLAWRALAHVQMELQGLGAPVPEGAKLPTSSKLPKVAS